jgi:hypothetical protein
VWNPLQEERNQNQPVSELFQVTFPTLGQLFFHAPKDPVTLVKDSGIHALHYILKVALKRHMGIRTPLHACDGEKYGP